MPSDNELMAITGFRSTHAASTLVARLVDLALLDHEVTGRLLSGSWDRRCGIPLPSR